MEKNNQQMVSIELQRTEASIITAIGNGNGPLSAYGISNVVDFSYPGVFKHCKILKEKGFLNSEEVEGEKKVTKTVYSLTILGFAKYFLHIFDESNKESWDIAAQSLIKFFYLHPVNLLLCDIIKVSKTSYFQKELKTNAFEVYIRFAALIFRSMLKYQINSDNPVCNGIAFAFFTFIGKTEESKTSMDPASYLKDSEPFEHYLIVYTIFLKLKNYPKIWDQMKIRFKRTLIDWQLESLIYSMIFDKEILKQKLDKEYQIVQSLEEIIQKNCDES